MIVSWQSQNIVTVKLSEIHVIEDIIRIMVHEKLNTSFSYHRELFWKITLYGF